MIRFAFWHRFSRATRADRKLTRRLARRIEADRELAEMTSVHVYVLAGHVTLYGFVRGYRTRDRLLDVVCSVPGVRSVEASLQVLPVDEIELVDA
ncbi:MAG: BON domain-containing protein [Rhodothermus sp.]|nr:BON domain-containing protein [Rhodothermus sp.]